MQRRCVVLESPCEPLLESGTGTGLILMVIRNWGLSNISRFTVKYLVETGCCSTWPMYTCCARAVL